MRRVSYIENILRDLRYGVRILSRSPSFTLIAILSLGLGTGANTAVFQLLNALHLRALPVANPQELVEVRINGGNRGMGNNSGVIGQLTNPLWEQIRDHQEIFSGIFAWGDAALSLGQGTKIREAKGIWVSGDIFSVLGVDPLRGRLFNREDDRRGQSARNAVISYNFWQNYFGGEDSAIGKSLVINGESVTVIGVTPPNFFGLEVGRSFDIALPLSTINTKKLDQRDNWFLSVIGRLKPQWNLARAANYLHTISPALFEATVPVGYNASSNEAYRKFRLTAIPAGSGASRLRSGDGTALWLLLGITGLVLLIACTNLANLMLARMSAREHEFSVRLSPGASRQRLILQILCEGVIISCGVGLGVGLAQILSHGLIAFLTTGALPSNSMSIRTCVSLDLPLRLPSLPAPSSASFQQFDHRESSQGPP